MTSAHTRRAKVGKSISGHVIIATYADDTIFNETQSIALFKVCVLADTAFAMSQGHAMPYQSR